MADRPMGCGVIQDLLPLYVDGAAGEESRALVEEHLRSCPVCRRGAGAAAGAVGPSAGDGRRGGPGLGEGHPTPAGAAVTAAAAGWRCCSLPPCWRPPSSSASGYRAGSWRSGTGGGERRGSRWCCQRRGTGTCLFPLSGGSSLRYTYYENEPGLDFGYHFRPAAPAMRRPGCMWCSTGRHCWWVSLNRVEEVEGIEVTDPESGTVWQTYPVPRGALRGAGDSGRRGGGLGPPGSGPQGGDRSL